MTQDKDFKLTFPKVNVIFKNIKIPSLLGLIDIENLISSLIVFPNGKYVGEMMTSIIKANIINDINNGIIEMGHIGCKATNIKFNLAMDCEITIERTDDCFLN